MTFADLEYYEGELDQGTKTIIIIIVLYLIYIPLFLPNYSLNNAMYYHRQLLFFPGGNLDFGVVTV